LISFMLKALLTCPALKKKSCLICYTILVLTKKNRVNHAFVNKYNYKFKPLYFISILYIKLNHVAKVLFIKTHCTMN
jgi:hypothetical protein